MPYQPPNPVEMAFPLSGVDRSLPARQLQALTTYELLNVRAFPPSSDRLGGGSREGYSKLFEDPAGTEDEPRIVGLDVLTEATNITDPSSFTTEALAEDWTSQAEADPTDLGGDWVNLSIQSTQTQTADNFSVASDQLLLDEGAASTHNAIMCLYFVDQSVGVTAVIQANRTVTAAGGVFGASGECTLTGPMIAVDTAFREGIWAYFDRIGANEVQCKVYEFDGISLTLKDSSSTLTLEGTSTTTDYTIELKRDGSTVTANFTATAALSGGGDIDETLTFETALTGQGGGVACESGGFRTNARTIDSISLTKLLPPGNTIYATIDRTEANPIDANQYYLSSSFQGVSRSSAGDITLSPATATDSSEPDYPCVDDTANSIIVTNPEVGNADYSEELDWAVYKQVDQRYGLVLGVDASQAIAGEDIGCPVFRATTDGRNGLVLLLASDHDSTTGIVGIHDVGQGVKGIAFVDNVATDLGSISNGGSIQQLFRFHETGSYRVTDDGTNIRFYVNGGLVLSLNPSSFPNWTTAIGEALADNVACGFTSGIDISGTSNTRAELGNVQIVQGEGTAAINVSNVKNKLGIYSIGKVQVGDTNSLSITDITGPSLNNPLPSSASFNRKFYAVDGNNEIIVNPASNTSTDWSASVTDGVLPSGCGLVTFFRGSAYLARTDSDPSIWYKSRTLDPLDWDFGADPQVSSAVAGNNGSVGQPGDAIMALFPFSDDYLVFAMARSMGVLEGDPGYGGQFQIVSNEAGCVGPRAFCFDDKGNLFFVGAGGLFMMLKGGFMPEPVGPRKLRRALEELDIGNNLIQMAYRASDRTVRIYVTPTDGESLGTHFVFDTRTEGFFFDQIPLGFGPWAIEQTNGILDIDRNIIIGCNDQYIRRPDDAAFSDDGTAIASHIEIAVPEAQRGTAETICQELQFVLGEGGDTITWRWFSAASPEEVRLQTVGSEVASGTITGTGFKTPIGLRATGAAHKLRLEASSSTAQWCLERVIAMMGITTNRRR